MSRTCPCGSVAKIVLKLLTARAWLIILHRTRTIVGLWFMTPDGAVGPVRLRGILNRNLPLAKTGDFTLDQLLLIGAMHAVTSFTDSTFVWLIDMHKVQIFIAVAEIGQLAGTRIEKSFPVMALKTKGIVPFIKARIKFFGIILPQQNAVLRTMRIVAGPTGAISNRLVLMQGGRNSFTHRIMAADAKDLGIVLQHADIAIAMRTMAGSTALIQSGVLDLRILSFFTNILMAHQAKRVPCFWQHKLLRTTVRIMTGDAAIIDRRMDVLHPRQFFFIIVAHETEQIPFSSQLIGRVSGMHVVTTLAVPSSDRAMNQLLIGFILVTLVAEVLPEGGQHALLFPLVRIVAPRAITISDRRMGMGLSSSFILVTLITKSWNRVDKKRRLLTRMWIVTGKTISINNWRMAIHPFAARF